MSVRLRYLLILGVLSLAPHSPAVAGPAPPDSYREYDEDLPPNPKLHGGHYLFLAAASILGVICIVGWWGDRYYRRDLAERERRRVVDEDFTSGA